MIPSVADGLLGKEKIVMKKMNDRERTYLVMTLPILALFFCFNTLPLIKGFVYSFTNFKGYGLSLIHI